MTRRSRVALLALACACVWPGAAVRAQAGGAPDEKTLEDALRQKAAAPKPVTTGVPGQTPAGAQAAASEGPKPAHRNALLPMWVVSDAACALAVNGDPKADLKPGVAKKITVSPGEQLVTCTSAEAPSEIFSVVKSIRAGEQAVQQIDLAARVAARQSDTAPPVPQVTSQPPDVNAVTSDPGVTPEPPTMSEPAAKPAVSSEPAVTAEPAAVMSEPGVKSELATTPAPAVVTEPATTSESVATRKPGMNYEQAAKSESVVAPKPGMTAEPATTPAPAVQSDPPTMRDPALKSDPAVTTRALPPAGPSAENQPADPQPGERALERAAVAVGRNAADPPTLAFPVGDEVWDAVEHSAYYIDLPRRSRKVTVRFTKTMASEHVDGPSMNWSQAVTREIVPVNHKCVSIRSVVQGSVPGEPPMDTTEYQCGRLTLESVAGGSLVHAAALPEVQAFLQSDQVARGQPCNMPGSLPASELHASLTGTATRRGCAMGEYYLEDLGVWLYELGELDAEKQQYMVPTPGYHFQSADSGPHDKLTTTYDVFSWTATN